LAKLKEAVGHGSAASSQAVAAVKNAGGSRKPIAIAATAVVVVIGIAVGLGAYFWSSKHVAQVPAVAAITDKSIAVLPFVDMSEKKDQEYFGDGMAEEILDLLVKIPGLKVIGRTSSFQFKGKTEDLRAIGKQLDVAYVLEGSVRKSGDHLRVTAQLINSGNGTHLWSQTYDEDLSDVLKMQDEIAGQIARAGRGADAVKRRRTPGGWPRAARGVRHKVPNNPSGCGQTFLCFRFLASHRKPVFAILGEPAGRMRPAPVSHAPENKQSIHAWCATRYLMLAVADQVLRIS
jgi:TolB-like protein